MNKKIIGSYGFLVLCFLSAISFTFIYFESQGIAASFSYQEVIEDAPSHLVNEGHVIKNIVIALIDSFTYSVKS